MEISDQPTRVAIVDGDAGGRDMSANSEANKSR